MAEHFIVRLLRWLIWLTGMGVTICGAAICMQADSPQSGVFITLAGIAISGVVDAMDGHFDLLRVGIRGVVMFAMLALFLLMRAR